MKFLILAISAVLTATLYAYPDFGFLAYFSLIPYFYVIYSEVKKGTGHIKMYGIGYFWSMLYFVPLFHWFAYQYPLEYLGVSKLWALAYVIVSMLGTSLVLSLSMALLPLLYSLYAKSRLHSRFPLLDAVVIPAAYVWIEWSYTRGEIAVPWARLALTRQNSLLELQSASILGSYFVSFIIVFINAALALALIRFIRDKKINLLRTTAVLCSLLFLSNCLLGLGLYKADVKGETGEAVRCAAIQGNLISGRSEDLTLYETIDLFFELSLPEIEKGAKLLVYPESCFSTYLTENGPTHERIAEFAKEHDVTVVFGAFKNDSDCVMNVTYCITPDGKLSLPYSKQHLVPFGEFVPFRSVTLKLMPLLADLDMMESDITAGTEGLVWESPAGKLTSLICYDSAFEQTAIEGVRKGAEIITVSTNDSWFMDSAAIFEFNGQSKLRAIETRRYIVRSACSGVSDVIDPRGRVIDLQPVLTRGSVSGDVTPRSDMTFYVRHPMLFLSLCAAFALLCPAGYEVFSRIKNKTLQG